MKVFRRIKAFFRLRLKTRPDIWFRRYDETCANVWRYLETMTPNEESMKWMEEKTNMLLKTHPRPWGICEFVRPIPPSTFRGQRVPPRQPDGSYITNKR